MVGENGDEWLVPSNEVARRGERVEPAAPRPNEPSYGEETMKIQRKHGGEVHGGWCAAFGREEWRRG